MSKYRHVHLIILITVIVILTGCGTGGGSTPPDLALIVNGEEFSTSAGTYCWGGLCADGFYPPVIETFVEVSADGVITLEFGNPKPDSGFLSLALYEIFPDADSAASIRLDDVPNTITWTPDVPAGDYVLGVTAKWGRGDGSYHIGITVP